MIWLKSGETGNARIDNDAATMNLVNMALGSNVPMENAFA